MTPKREKVNQLIKKIQLGEYERVAELYSVIGNDLFFVAIRYMKNTFDADDVMQDFWLNIDKYCKKILFVTNGYAYLVRCLENLCKMKLRKEKSLQSHLSTADLNALEEVLAAEEDLTERQRELKTSFDKVQEGLTEEERLLFSLLRFGDYSVRKTASILGWSKSKTERVKQKVFAKAKETLIKDGWDRDDL